MVGIASGLAHLAMVSMVFSDFNQAASFIWLVLLRLIEE